MRREWIAPGPLAGEGMDLRGRGDLLSGELVLGRRSLELLELKLQLIEQTLLALVALKQVALELLDRQPQMRSGQCLMLFGARCLGTRLQSVCRASSASRASSSALASRHRPGKESGVLITLRWNHNTAPL